MSVAVPRGRWHPEGIQSVAAWFMSPPTSQDLRGACTVLIEALQEKCQLLHLGVGGIQNAFRNPPTSQDLRGACTGLIEALQENASSCTQGQV